MALTAREREHLDLLEARLNKPLADRLRESGYSPDGPPQVAAFKPYYTRVAPRWCSAFSKFDSNGRPLVESRAQEREYAKNAFRADGGRGLEWE